MDHSLLLYLQASYAETETRSQPPIYCARLECNLVTIPGWSISWAPIFDSWEPITVRQHSFTRDGEELSRLGLDAHLSLGLDMLPRFKYLSKNLFSPKKPDQEKYFGNRDGSQTQSARTKPRAGELFTTTTMKTNFIGGGIKPDVILTSSTPGDASAGFLAGARDFVLNQPMFIDNSHNTNYLVIGIPVLRTLKDAGTPEAALDSAVRYPPPKCHPGSRRTINERLERWLNDTHRQRKMTWLYGPAGVGKSAVAQTFGELARERGCLGAAFFSAFNDLPTDSSRIIPTLAYQLAIRNPSYKQVVTPQLAGDPSILDAALHAQFQKLIIEPFLLLAPTGAQQTTKLQPYVIILDGLDECEDEDAQCQLIELINSAAQRKDLPLMWLLCSRPESHIKYTFSKEELIGSCDREELLIDDEARADVERFLRDSFKGICKRYGFDGVWPPEDAFDTISKAVSGYFVFASVVIRVVGDRTAGDPETQLSALLKMLRGLDDIGMNNPLDTLDIFYSRILSGVPSPALPIAKLILGIYARGEPSEEFTNAEQFWLLLRIKKEKFYYSLDKLHSVMRIPSPKDARSERLSFYHKSFADYLRRQRRSSEFFISDARVFVLLGSNSFYWYNQVLVYRDRGLVGSEEYGHAQVMMKKWYSTFDTESEANECLGSAALLYGSKAVEHVTEADSDFFDVLREFNFGLLTKSFDTIVIRSLLKYMHTWDWSKTPAGAHFTRSDIFDETVDRKLLYHLSILSDGKRIPPLDTHKHVTYFRGKPQPWGGPEKNTIGYVIIGRGLKSGLVICFGGMGGAYEMIVLNAHVPPTTKDTLRCLEWLRNIKNLKRL